MQGALLARREGTYRGPASLSAGPRCRASGLAPRLARRPIEIATEHRVVRHQRLAVHAWELDRAKFSLHVYIRVPNESLQQTGAGWTRWVERLV